MLTAQGPQAATIPVMTISVYCSLRLCWAQGMWRGDGDFCPQETLLCDPGHDADLSGSQRPRPRHGDGKSDSTPVVGSDEITGAPTQASGHLTSDR